jgi:hypothetical protein
MRHREVATERGKGEAVPTAERLLEAPEARAIRGGKHAVASPCRRIFVSALHLRLRGRSIGCGRRGLPGRGLGRRRRGRRDRLRNDRFL